MPGAAGDARNAGCTPSMGLLARHCSGGVESLAMAVLLFRPDVDRTRRAAGWIFIADAVVLAGGLVWLDIAAGRGTGKAPPLFAPLRGALLPGPRLPPPPASLRLHLGPRPAS